MLLEENGLVKKADFIRNCLMPALKRDLTEYKVPHIQHWLQLLRVSIIACYSCNNNIRTQVCKFIYFVLRILLKWGFVYFISETAKSGFSSICKHGTWCKLGSYPCCTGRGSAKSLLGAGQVQTARISTASRHRAAGPTFGMQNGQHFRARW